MILWYHNLILTLHKNKFHGYGKRSWGALHSLALEILRSASPLVTDLQ